MCAALQHSIQPFAPEYLCINSVTRELAGMVGCGPCTIGPQHCNGGSGWPSRANPLKSDNSFVIDPKKTKLGLLYAPYDVVFDDTKIFEISFLVAEICQFEVRSGGSQGPHIAMRL
jgi:hypothetical protein